MVTKATHITDLYYRSTIGQLGDLEQAQLDDWLTKYPVHAMHLKQLFDDEKFNLELSKRSPASLAALDDELYSAIISRIHTEKNTIIPAAHRVHFLKTTWFRVAATILFIIGIGAYLWNQNKINPASTTEVSVNVFNNNIAPGYDRAILTLSNGKNVELNNASQTITDGNLSIENKNGQLSYNHSDVAAINTMTTPKGGQYRLTLADGTKVWMNAASSITFPTAFIGKTREVSVTGEVYFEVARNKQKSFIVSTGQEKILVLGTSFNVNTYDNDQSTKTSLIEGSIKIANTVLHPGQAFVNNKVIATNIDQDIAWKNGEFNFDHLQVQQVMRQIARWYNIEIKYEGPIPHIEFRGNMGRNLTLNQVLESLELMGMQFTLKDRLLTVSQKNY